MAARSVAITLGGQQWRMPVNYRAAMQIARTVGDPLQMVQKAARGQLNWTLDNVVSIVEAGLSAAGCSLTRDQIGDEIVQTGLEMFLQPASEYVTALVTGGPEKPLDPKR